LSAFLRGSTELLTRPDARLDEEAALVTHYLHVMASRLGERLHWQVDIDPALHGVLLPPGLLLTLVENAIEHGASQSLHSASLVLSAQALAGRLRLCVKDSAGRWHAGTPDGVGLRNTRQRLLHRYGASASLTLQLHEGNTLAVIELPLDAPTCERASLPPAAP
jgi:LytS/YehU family sensor histidine kinase